MADWEDAPKGKKAPAKTEDPFAYLDISGIRGDTPADKFTRLNLHDQELLTALSGASKEYYERTGKKLPLTSGARTWEDQNELYQRWLKGDKSIFTPVNPEKYEKTHVFHTNAVDIPTGVADAELKKYGLLRPLKNDQVHVQLGITPMTQPTKKETQWEDAPIKKADEEEYVPVAQQIQESGESIEIPKSEQQVASTRSADYGTYGAGAGAVKGVIEKIAINPEKPAGPNVASAQENFQKASDRLEVARNRLATAGGDPSTIADLEAEFQRSQGVYRQAEEELRQAQARMAEFKARPTTTPSVTVEAAPNDLVPTDAQHTRGLQGGTDETGATGRARQTTYNERTAQIARNQKQQGQVINQLARQGVVDPNKVAALSETHAASPSGLLMPSDVVYEQELKQKIASSSVEGERSALQAELDRLKSAQKEASIGRSTAQRNLRGAQVSSGRQVQAATSAAAKAEDNVTIAKNALERAEAQQPGTFAKIGYTLAKNPFWSNALGGLGTGLSVSEAINRYNKGDTSGAVLSTIEAAFGALSMTPPVTPPTMIAKGVGTVGGLGMIPVMMAHDYIKEKMAPPTAPAPQQ